MNNLSVIKERKIEKETINITMLGTSGVGKTSFLAGMIKDMSPYLIPQTNIYARMEYKQLGGNKGSAGFRIINKLIDFTRKNDPGFPEGTDIENGEVVIRYDFDLIIKKDYRWPLSIFDYKGGFIGHEGEDEDNEQMFLDKCGIADVILIMIDGIRLAEYYESGKIDDLLGVEEVTLLFMNSIVPKIEDRNVCIEFIITKTDSERINLGENKYKKLVIAVEEIYGRLIGYCRANQDLWKVIIIPVSMAGEGNTASKPDENGDYIETREKAMKPENIGSSIIYGAYCKFNALLSEIEKEIDKCSEFIEKIETNQSFFNRIFNKSSFSENKKEMQWKQEQLKEQKDEINRIIEIFSNPNEQNTVSPLERIENDILESKEKRYVNMTK